MKIVIAAIVLLLVVAVPLYFIYRRAKSGKKGKAPFIANLCCFFGLVVFSTVFLFSQGASAAETAAASATAAASGDSFTLGMRYIAAALAVGLSGIGGGIAVASSASAALGALSESDAIFGKSLIYVGLAEGVALYGLLIAFMILPT